jgi:proteic killer suppression protein
MIRSFADKVTEDLYHGRRNRRVSRLDARLVRAAVRKLDMIEAAASVTDLQVPPGNRLERLRGELEGLHSIRVNDQWRIVFRWSAGGAEGVRLMDYH